MSELLRQYMWGQLTDDERAALHLRLLADQALCDELRDEENDLIDALARGELLPADAVLMETHLRATGQLDRLELARLLQSRPRRKRPIFVYLAGIAAVIVIGVGLNQQRTPAPVAISQTAPAFALRPGVLRDAPTLQQLPGTSRGAGRRLQLLYQDVKPAGTCTATLYDARYQPKQTVSGDCGGDWFELTLRTELPIGRYRIDLKAPDGELLHVYLFDATL